MSSKTTSVIELFSRQLTAAAEQESDSCTIFRLRAAVCALAGDSAGCEQNLAASKIPQADWDAAKNGTIEY